MLKRIIHYYRVYLPAKKVLIKHANENIEEYIKKHSRFREIIPFRDNKNQYLLVVDCELGLGGQGSYLFAIEYREKKDFILYPVRKTAGFCPAGIYAYWSGNFPAVEQKSLLLKK